MDQMNQMEWDIGMAIVAQPTDTRLGPTLMDRVLLGLIKNRVGFGFLKKKTRSGFGLGLSFWLKPNPNLDPTQPSYELIQLQKNPYIYIDTYKP